MRCLHIIFSSILILLSQFIFSQDDEHYGGRYVKRYENNIIMLEAGYNFDCKEDVEKLFFGDFNAPIEFFYLPSFEGGSGFRIVKDTLTTSYLFEFKFISNYKEARKLAGIMHPIIALPLGQGIPISDDLFNKIVTHNNEAASKIRAESINYFKIDSHSFSISKEFAELLYQKFVIFIDNFKSKRVPSLIYDGYSVTFRTVVDNEVWTLNIHMPKGKALKMADFCRQIMNDAENNQLDEEKYISILNTF